MQLRLSSRSGQSGDVKLETPPWSLKTTNAQGGISLSNPFFCRTFLRWARMRPRFPSRRYVAPARGGGSAAPAIGNGPEERRAGRVISTSSANFRILATIGRTTEVKGIWAHLKGPFNPRGCDYQISINPSIGHILGPADPHFRAPQLEIGISHWAFISVAVFEGSESASIRICFICDG